jgi:hypothetical protein
MNNWTNFAAAGLGLLGANQANKAAKQAADAQLQAGQLAADAAAFKPYSVTTGYGTGFFDAENQTAGYELDPALQAYRDRLMMMGAEGLPTSMDPTANAQTYYDEMLAMQAPGRAQQDTQMQQDAFGSGRLGLRLAGEAAGAGAGAGMYQPDYLGMNKARELQNMALAQQARQQSMNELDASIARGTGLMQQGLGVEQLGMTPLTMGAEFGGMGSNAGAAQGTALMQGGLGAAQANLAAGLGSSNTLSNLGLGLMKYNT